MSTSQRPSLAGKSRISSKEVIRVLLLLFIVLLAAHHTMFSSVFVETQGGGDSILDNYFLEHDWRWVTQQTPDKHFFSPPMFYPVAGTMGYSDLFLAGVPFYAPWRLLGAAPQTAFQFWILTISALNFLSMYLLLRLLVKASGAASSIGAFLFAFGIPRMMQIDHKQLLPGFYMVGVLVGLWLLFDRPAGELSARRVWTAGLLATGCAVAQFYLAFYYFWFMVFAAPLALLSVLLVPSLRKALLDFVRTWWWVPLSCAALAALLLYPAIGPYLRANKGGARSYEVVSHFLPTPLAWFAVGPGNWIYGRLNQALGIDQSFGGSEMFLGIGLLTTVLVVIAFLKFYRRPVILIFGFVSAAIIILTLSWHGFSLWRYVFPFFPGAQAVRAISRFGVFLLLPAAIGLALTIDWLAHRFSPVVAVLCLLAVFVEQAGSFNAVSVYNKNQFEASAEVTAHDLRPGCKTLLFTWTQGSTSLPFMHLVGMWAETFAHVPTLNGYSGGNPPDWPFENVSIASRLDRLRLFETIRSWMKSHPFEVENVCWVGPANSMDIIRQPDLDGDALQIRRTYLELLGRLPKDPELAAITGPPTQTIVDGIVATPEYQGRELFAFAAYRALLHRDPPLPVWARATEDLEFNGKSNAQLVEGWQRSDECRAVQGCATSAPDAVILQAGAELPRDERVHDSRVLLYYSLLQRDPTPAELNSDPSEMIRAAFRPR